MLLHGVIRNHYFPKYTTLLPRCEYKSAPFLGGRLAAALLIL